MKAQSANLLNLLKGPRQFIIPIYQRTYSWHISQCQQLLQDILRIDPEQSGGHFVGSVVYFQESIHTVSDVPRLLVIDGQQRLTTITLLLAALAEFVADNAGLLETSATKLKNYYLFNAEEEGELRYKLLLTRRDKQPLMDLLQGIAVNESTPLRIVENFQFFKAGINADNVAAIYNGLMRLFVVDVALEKEVDNPQLIFESLNSTGLDLSQADLIRNYILMGQQTALQTELYEKHWLPMEQNYGDEYSQYFDRFMRDYLSVKIGNISKIGHVYDAFKNYANSDRSPGNIRDLVADIHRFSGYYANMALHKEPCPSLARVFKRIARLKANVSYPFLLAVYADYAADLLTEGEFEQLLCLVENYVFRRAICGIPTNSLNKTFANLYKSVQQEHYLKSVEAAFMLLGSYKRFPADSEFHAELVSKDVYNLRTRNYLLERLENHQRKEPVVISEYTIEHVLPQNPKLCSDWQAMLGESWKQVQESYLHTLGNLTLTGYNSELSDHPFGDKQTMEGGFNDSPLRMNSLLRQTQTECWNEEKIKQRANELADKAKAIWFAPLMDQTEVFEYLFKPAKEASYSLDSYEHLHGDMRALYDRLQQRILNIDASVAQECKKLYIAFKSTTNFVDVVPQKVRLRLSLNMPFSDLIDPKGLCRDVTGLGRWGNGDVELGLADKNELDDVMELIQQAFDREVELD
tara:strand:- start:1741 stop:3819 length:2079 start_codon:yes stop_codon:yes gene_type:complete